MGTLHQIAVVHGNSTCFSRTMELYSLLPIAAEESL